MKSKYFTDFSRLFYCNETKMVDLVSVITEKIVRLIKRKSVGQIIELSL